MATPDNLDDFLSTLYGALSSADLEAWSSLQADDVIYNVNGSTAVSGRTMGKEALLTELLPLLFSRIQADTAKIGINWRCMCSDDKRAVVIFEGESTTLEGAPYNNRYMQTMEFNDEGKICEVWEFFDTALAEGVLFTPDQTPPPGTEDFQY